MKKSVYNVLNIINNNNDCHNQLGWLVFSTAKRTILKCFHKWTFFVKLPKLVHKQQQDPLHPEGDQWGSCWCFTWYNKSLQSSDLSEHNGSYQTKNINYLAKNQQIVVILQQ